MIADLNKQSDICELPSRNTAMNCDRVARLYRWIEYAVFGRALERARTALLGELASAQRVLALGDGDGRALVALADATPSARIDYIDASATMLKLARARLGPQHGGDRVTFHQADAREMRLPDSTYDAIVTHFFFDCFDSQDLEAVITKAAGAAAGAPVAPPVMWIVSEFRPATRSARLLIAIMYAFFGAATGLKTRRLVDHHPLLRRHGFRLRRAQHSWGGMIASELWVR